MYTYAGTHMYIYTPDFRVRHPAKTVFRKEFSLRGDYSNEFKCTPTFFPPSRAKWAHSGLSQDLMGHSGLSQRMKTEIGR